MVYGEKQRQALVYKVINLQVPHRTINFLASLGTY